jgi:hypothetical protein
MANENLLHVTSVPHAVGSAYELSPEWRNELIAAVGSAAPPGLLLPEMRLLLVGARDTAAFARGLQVAVADPRVVWAARLDGPARLLLAVEAEDAAEREHVDRLESILSSEGLDVGQLRVDRLLDVESVVSYARELGARPHPAIPPST